MASIAPGQAYFTDLNILAGTSATDVYTVGENGEEAIFLTGVLVTDSTGSVSTAATVAIRRSSTNYVLASTGMGLPSATENLEIVCEPAIRMKRDDTVRVTGASGHHVFVSFVTVGDRTGVLAQQR